MLVKKCLLNLVNLKKKKKKKQLSDEKEKKNFFVQKYEFCCRLKEGNLTNFFSRLNLEFVRLLPAAGRYFDP